MRVMIVCRENLYDRLKTPIPKECEVSPPQTTLNEVIDWIQNQDSGIDLMVIDTGLSRYEPICSLPYRHYKYEGDPNYEVVIKDLLSTIKLAKERTQQSNFSVIETQPGDIVSNRDLAEEPAYISSSSEEAQEIKDQLQHFPPGKAEEIDILIAPPQTETDLYEVPVMSPSMPESHNPFGLFTQALEKGREAFGQVKMKGRAAVQFVRDSEQKNPKPEPARDPWYCLGSTPRRVVCYSPKGGTGATSIVLEIAELFDAGVVEVSTRYGQLAGKLGAQPLATVDEIEEGSEDEAVWKNRFVFSPWVFPLMKEVNETEIKSWLMNGERAFRERMLVVDLMSQAPVSVLKTTLEWGAKHIWVLHDTTDHLGMADLQLSFLQRSGANLKMIGILIQVVSGQRLPWEETLGVKVIGHIEAEIGTKEWKTQVRELTSAWLMKF